jgi:hypothetical protein
LKEKQVKAFSTVNNRRVAFFGVLIFMLAAASISALAQQRTQVLREVAGGYHTGMCCSTWDEFVIMHETGSAVPIIVTWSTEYQANAPFLVGLSLNGGYCTFFGPGSIPAFSSTDDTLTSMSFQWVIMPGDYGLRRGRNVIHLCGGGVFGDTGTITIGFNTLAAQLAE